MDAHLEALDALTEGNLQQIIESWECFCTGTDSFLSGDLSVAADSDEYAASVRALSHYGLTRLVGDHFLQALEESFRKNAVSKFWKSFNPSSDITAASTVSSLSNVISLMSQEGSEEMLTASLEEICMEKVYQEKLLSILLNSLLSEGDVASELEDYISTLLPRHQLMVSSVLHSTLPQPFLGILRLYFRKILEELSSLITGECEDGYEASVDSGVGFTCKSDMASRAGAMEIEEVYDQSVTLKNNELIKNIGKLVRDLRSLGFTSVTEDAYASAIFSLLKIKVQYLAGDDYRSPVLESIKEWIQAVPLQFLNALLGYLGDSAGHEDSNSGLKSPLASLPTCYPGIDMPSEELVRWQLRIAKLFEIIVDYPDSSPAIEDLKQCLDCTGQHSKLVDSFISSLRFRLLTAGASTNDILHQYVSTIKALRIIDPTGVFLEAVGEPIREYLRRRKDTIKCIVTMLTDGSDSLLEELNRNAENQESADYDDDLVTDDKQAWINAMRWEPDPVEADPARGSRNRRKIDILGMMVSIIGSKDQLVNEHRIMLAEKLLNKSDYDIDSEIRTLELLKIHFGESSMQRCEIMLNDLIDSKRTNSNIKVSAAKATQIDAKQDEGDMSLEVFDATIISSNSWPPIQAESINVPVAVEELLSDYARRFHEVKAPRKLLWRKNLGVVKLELQFEDRALQFTVSPVQATIILKFQEQASWTSKNLAAAVGTPVDILNRRISFWVSKGILVESPGSDSYDHIYTVVDEMSETNRNGLAKGTLEDLSANDEEGEGSLASVEEQLRKEMTIYEKFIVGMLTNFGSMALDRIHNTLKMFCIAEPTYDKSVQQLQSFLEGLIAEEKLEMRDGMYVLKR
ncbi:unnamed protein product [Spirodela intermedia]|uniref:Anaphase-promoting complex subunit 2 n=1 Tax=Spirodela intermedia TaxID=51605 RepID=A0A7I8J599_SPIIN|nr:unnamed protein product [Spirodela intermedia]CAA6665214.1 unnamed protein product [Spirodela intermedia]